MADARFCSQCGAPLERRVPAHDNMERLVCSRCDHVHYELPRVLVGCFVTCGQRLLWIRRAISPYKGLWTVPGGFLERGEDPREAAARELFEETGVSIDRDALQLYLMGSICAINEIHLVFRGRVQTEQACCTDEADAVGFFTEAEAPWGQFAYPAGVAALRQFYREHADGSYGVYMGKLSQEYHQLEPIRSC